MTREQIANQLSDVCNIRKIDEEMQLAFDVMTRQELIDAGGEDANDLLYGDDYDWVIMYSDNPDYCFISNNDAVSELAMHIDNWIEELKFGH